MVTSVLLPLVVYYQLKLYIATISLERLQAFHTYHSVSMELLWDRTKPMITLVWLNTSLRHLQNIYLSTYQLLNLISQFPTKCSSFTSTISLRGHNTTALSRYKSVFLFWKWVQKPTYKICPSVRRVSKKWKAQRLASRPVCCYSDLLYARFFYYNQREDLHINALGVSVFVFCLWIQMITITIRSLIYNLHKQKCLGVYSNWLQTAAGKRKTRSDK